MTYKEYIALSCQMALAGQNSIASQILDIEMVAESLVPDVFQAVAVSYANDPQRASLLSRDHTISLTDGVGVVPDAALTQCKFNATVSDPDDDTIAAQMGLARTKLDLIGTASVDRLLGKWCIVDTTFYWVEPGEVFSPTSGKTGDVVLNISSTPEIPATEDDQLVVAEEALSDLISSLAQRLRGKLEVAA